MNVEPASGFEPETYWLQIDWEVFEIQGVITLLNLIWSYLISSDGVTLVVTAALMKPTEGKYLTRYPFFYKPMETSELWLAPTDLIVRVN